MSLNMNELGRYLDYCSELLAVVSNVAALYAQGDDDSITLQAVDSIEELCSGISRKLWQKMQMIGDRGA